MLMFTLLKFLKPGASKVGTFGNIKHITQVTGSIELNGTYLEQTNLESSCHSPILLL